MVGRAIPGRNRHSTSVAALPWDGGSAPKCARHRYGRSSGAQSGASLTVAAKFRITHQPGKGYHFNVVATSGRVIARSEHYETHRACLEGIESVRKNAPQAELDDPTAKRD